MKIINREGNKLGLRMFDGKDTTKFSTIDCGVVENNESITLGEPRYNHTQPSTGRLQAFEFNKQDEYKLTPTYVSYFDNIFGAMIANPCIATPPGLCEMTGVFDINREVVIRKFKNMIYFIDWTLIKEKWSKENNPVSEVTRSGAIDGLTVANDIMNALVTGVAAIGPEAAIPAGGISLIGSLLLNVIGMQQPAPPPPPNIKQIKDVVEKAIEEETEKEQARLASTTLLAGYEWLVEQSTRAKALLYADSNGVTTDVINSTGNMNHWEKDFMRNLEKNTDSNEIFLTQLNFCLENPEVAKFVLPALCAGVTAHLHIHRLHDIVRHSHGEKITKTDLQIYKTKCMKAVEGLSAALYAFNRFAMEKVDKEGLAGTPEGKDLYKWISLKYTGHENPQDFLFGEHKDKIMILLKKLFLSINEDIRDLENGKQIKRYYHTVWDSTLNPANANQKSKIREKVTA